MVSNFYSDLKQAKVGEGIVLDVLQNCCGRYEFTDVSDDRRYFYKGDIDAYDARNDKHYFLDVKMDSRIAETGNILCEEEVYFENTGEYTPGNMSSDYDYLAIISTKARKIYIIDFELLKEHYREGRNYVKNHGEQTTYGTLFPLKKAQHYGMIEAVIDYEDYQTDRGNAYVPSRIMTWPQTLTEAV